MTVSAEELHDTSTRTSREQFIEIAAPLFTRLTEPIKSSDGSLSLDEIDQVVLVGGSCKMPVVKLYVNCVLQQADSIGSWYHCGFGCRCLCWYQGAPPDIRDILLTDICPFLSALILLTLWALQRFDVCPYWAQHDASASRTGIYQLHSQRWFQSKSNLKSTRAKGATQMKTVRNICPCPAKGPGDRWCPFHHDINGILEVEATALSTKNTKSLLLISDSNTTDKHEIEKGCGAQKYKIHPKDKDETDFFSPEVTGCLLRQWANSEKPWNLSFSCFSHALEKPETHAISKARERFFLFSWSG